MLHPDPSVELLRAALIHDDGEFAVGDMKAPSKDKFPVIADALEELEYIARCEIWGHCEEFHERQWLKFADRLDAYMWARHHAPHAMGGDGWPDAYDWLGAQANILNCVDGFHNAVGLD
ncbi:hypothetical protein [Sulfitobacter pacificus]|uniref:hypothetical protein n=1 Tax=Sulfitobacter pacificus TaxID=1499314 RepID=UPI003105BF52